MCAFVRAYVCVCVCHLAFHSFGLVAGGGGVATWPEGLIVESPPLYVREGRPYSRLYPLLDVAVPFGCTHVL